MAFSAIIKPSDYFNTKLYTGNGSNSHAITGVGFEPSFVWIKDRTNSYDHCAFDQPRGVSQRIYPNNAQAQSTDNDNLVSFDSDGFTVDDNGITNHNGYNFVSWNWKANGQGSSNTAGSINTTYTSANTTSGCSIITYTGNSTSGATIGHGLGVAPKVVIVKALNSASYDWGVYHASLGNTKNLRLNLTDAEATSTAFWNDTTPSSSLVYLGSNGTVNADSINYVAYCFAEKQGFSKFGSYVGNGNADGGFIYTGFKPAFVMTKPSSGAGSWYMLDNKRANPFNAVTGRLEADGSGSENTGNTWCDFTSNGFKIRTTEGGINASGVTYIYIAFAETPFVANSGESIPTTAR